MSLRGGPEMIGWVMSKEPSHRILICTTDDEAQTSFHLIHE